MDLGFNGFREFRGSGFRGLGFQGLGACEVWVSRVQGSGPVRGFWGGGGGEGGRGV